MARFAVGDRVLIKGFVGGGHTGTIVRIKRPRIAFGLTRVYHVQLDGTVLGHSILRVSKMNLEHAGPADHEPGVSG
jgi:hypothetical protein